MHVLGISTLRHDSAACLLEDGRIMSAAQEIVYEGFLLEDKKPEIL